jgi:hypothetical protein
MSGLAFVSMTPFGFSASGSAFSGPWTATRL